MVTFGVLGITAMGLMIAGYLRNVAMSGIGRSRRFHDILKD